MITKNKFLSDAEIKHLHDFFKRYPGKRDTLLIQTLSYTGARCSEVILIKKKDLSNNSITVTATKNSNDRTVPVPAKFFSQLREYVKDLQDKDIIFSISTRRIRKIWDQIRINKNKGSHCLRHTFALKLYMNCENIHLVQTALGHLSIQNTIHYMNFVESQRKLRQSMAGMWAERNKLDVA